MAKLVLEAGLVSTPQASAVPKTKNRGPEDHIKIWILQSMISGIPLILSLGTRMADPCVYVVLWSTKDFFCARACEAHERVWHAGSLSLKSAVPDSGLLNFGLEPRAAKRA